MDLFFTVYGSVLHGIQYVPVLPGRGTNDGATVFPCRDCTPPDTGKRGSGPGCPTRTLPSSSSPSPPCVSRLAPKARLSGSLFEKIIKSALEIYVRTLWRQAGIRRSGRLLFMSECTEMFGTYSNTGALLDTGLRAVLDSGFGNIREQTGSKRWNQARVYCRVTTQLCRCAQQSSGSSKKRPAKSSGNSRHFRLAASSEASGARGRGWGRRGSTRLNCLEPTLQQV